MKAPRALGLFLLLPMALFAQDRDRGRGDDRRDAPRVIVYQDADYQGDYIVLQPGDRIENMASARFPNGARLNDAISSVRVENGAEVYLYTDARFGGAVLRLTESARNLTGRMLPGSVTASWNDRVSSLRVEALRRGEPPRVDADALILKVFREMLGRDPFDQDRRYFRDLIVDQGWNERMVRDQIRRWDEYRGKGVDRIIRQAYLDVLGREPDARGLQEFRRNLLEKDWTEGDVRDELRRSDEFRRKAGNR